MDTKSRHSSIGAKKGGEINRCCGVLWFLVVVGSKTVRRYESYVVVRRIDAKVPRYVPRTSWSQMVFPPVPQRWDSQGYMGHTDPAPAPQKRVYPAPIRQSGSLVSCARGPFRLGCSCSADRDSLTLTPSYSHRHTLSHSLSLSVSLSVVYTFVCSFWRR